LKFELAGLQLKMQARRRLKGQHDTWPGVVEASLTPSGQRVRRDRAAPQILAVEVRDKVCRCKRWSATQERRRIRLTK
jgi:hypothetical protein